MRLYPFFIPHGGCPHRCRFCRQERLSGQAEAPTPTEVALVLERVLPPSGDGEVAFYGGSFTLLAPALQEEYLGCAAPFIRHKRVSGIRISTRPDALSLATIDRLRSGGVTTVEIGCQSFCDAVLLRSGRGHGAGAAAGALVRLRDAGLAVGLQLMPGLPGGSRAEAFASLERALEMRPDFIRIYPALVLRGTAMEKDFHAGSYRPMELEEAVEVCAGMLARCLRRKVPVIRLGVQGTPEIEAGDVVAAGPWHPAFGQLVRCRLWRRSLEQGGLTTGLRRAEVHPFDISDAQGHRRCNIDFLRHCFGEFSIAANRLIPRGHLAFAEQRFALTDLCGYEGQDH